MSPQELRSTCDMFLKILQDVHDGKNFSRANRADYTQPLISDGANAYHLNQVSKFIVRVLIDDCEIDTESLQRVWSPLSTEASDKMDSIYPSLREDVAELCRKYTYGIEIEGQRAEHERFLRAEHAKETHLANQARAEAAKSQEEADQARAEAAIREVASGDTKAVVPGPMVTLVMITKSLGSAISVEQFVLLAPAAGKREAFAREVEGRLVGRKASNAVPANA